MERHRLLLLCALVAQFFISADAADISPRAAACKLPDFRGANFVPVKPSTTCRAGASLPPGRTCEIGCAPKTRPLQGKGATDKYTCSADGVLTSPKFYFSCVGGTAVMCNVAKLPEAGAEWTCNGKTDSAGRVDTDTKCTKQCPTGYTGSRTITCDLGTWTAEVNKCVEKPKCDGSSRVGWQCSTTRSADGKMVDGTVCQLSCPAGQTGTPLTSKCTMGKWSNPGTPRCINSPCDPSKRLPAATGWNCNKNANADGTLPDGTICQLPCAAGFAGNPSSSTCSKGVWSAYSLPTCKAVGCAASGVTGQTCDRQAANGQYPAGTKCGIPCSIPGKYGFPSMSVCASTGAWQPQAGQCTDCTPIKKGSGPITCTSATNSKAASGFTCKKGYCLKSNASPLADKCEPCCPNDALCKNVTLNRQAPGCGTYYAYDKMLIRYEGDPTTNAAICTGIFEMYSNPELNDISDETFLGLTAMTELNIMFNKLTRVAASYFPADLKALKKMSLLNNELTDIAPGAFSKLTVLQELQMNQCKLPNIGANHFQGLVALTYLNLARNLITGVAPAAFGHMPLLQKLNMDVSQLPALPSNLFSGAFGLTEFSCSGTDTLLAIEDDAFKGPSALQKLTLTSNKINTIGDHAFRGHTALTELLLNNNEISTYSSTTFNADLASLKILNFKYNKFSNLPAAGLSNLVGLTYLTFMSNQITALAGQEFQGLISLSTLQLRNNQIASVATDMFKSNQFATLTMDLDWEPNGGVYCAGISKNANINCF